MSSGKEDGFANGRPFVKRPDPPQGYSKHRSSPRIAGSPATNGLQAAGNKRSKANGKGPEHTEEDIATPIKSFLNSNITPRSGSRKARAESASPTPNCGPNVNPINLVPSKLAPLGEKRQESGIDTQAIAGLPLRCPTIGRPSRTGSVSSDGPWSTSTYRPPHVERRNSGTSATNSDTTPKFFHANDVQATKRSRPTSVGSTPKAWVAGYANERIENVPTGRLSAMSNNSSVLDEQKSKSWYANDFHDTDSSHPRLNNSARPNRPTLETIYSEHPATAATSPVRPTSPLKEEVLPRKSSVAKASPRRHTRLLSNGGTELKSPETIGYGNVRLSRRSSLNSPANPRISTHARSASMHSTGPSPSRKSSISIADASPLEKARTTSALSNNSILDCNVKPSTTAQYPPISPLRMQPQSPTRAQSKLDHMNELAANARKERKVLDLEISNSSLLAINRALEREMRKQNAELRKYRRLSRSGRLSIAPTSRSASGRKPMLSERYNSFDSEDLWSPSGSEDEDSEDALSNISSPSAKSQLLSPTSRTARDRFKDPKIPPLDLTVHRALLLESQNFNQSIKRCLGHTESLIASGRTALRNKVSPPEIENLGPKVLTPDEVEDEVIDRRQGLLSPSIPSHGDASNPWEQSLGHVVSLNGGLETAHLPKLGPPTEETKDMHLQESAAKKMHHDDRKIQGGFPPASPHKDSAANLADDGYPSPAGATESSDPIADSPPAAREASMPPPNLPTSSSNIDQDVKKEAVASDAHNEVMNTPGNRNSMQNLGLYLQSLGIFGPGGIRPP
ncbi:MAG: hypothetical protein Q9217_001193 [Psora testacea]